LNFIPVQNDLNPVGNRFISLENSFNPVGNSLSWSEMNVFQSELNLFPCGLNLNRLQNNFFSLGLKCFRHDLVSVRLDGQTVLEDFRRLR